MKYMKLLALSLMLLVSFGYAGIVHALGTTEPASQVVSYYNTEDTNAFVQVTNTNLGSDVDIHIQVLDEECDEVNFFDNLTPLDTNVYNIDGIIGAGTRGIVVINAVVANGDFNPIDFPFLIGTTTLVDDDSGDSNDVAFLFNNLGRQLVDGAWELHQPDSILSPINTSTLYNRNVFVSLAWADVFAGGYIAITGDAETTDPLVGVFIVDDEEVKDSCGQFSVECVSELAPTTDSTPFPGSFDSAGEVYVCDKSSEDLGLVQLLDIVSTDNYVALAGGNTGELAGMDYAVNTTVQATGEGPVEDCSDGADNDGDGDTDCADADCAGSASCAEGGAGSCDDVADNDGDGDTDCADADCDGVGSCEFGTELSCNDGVDNDADGQTDCADTDDCSADAACDGGGTGGTVTSSSGCSVASAATGLGSMANALVLLVPAFGIGVRRIRRRLNK